MMVLAKIWVGLSSVVAFFVIQTENGSMVMLRRLEFVMLYMLRYGGLYLALEMAWREHFSHLIVESGSKNLVYMTSDNFKFNGNISTLVHCIRQLLKSGRENQPYLT